MSHDRARHQIRDCSESGRSRELLTPGTSDSCRPRGVVTRDFSAIFDRLPVLISTSDLHQWIPRKKSLISELVILECSFPLKFVMNPKVFELAKWSDQSLNILAGVLARCCRHWFESCSHPFLLLLSSLFQSLYVSFLNEFFSFLALFSCLSSSLAPLCRGFSLSLSLSLFLPFLLPLPNPINRCSPNFCPIKLITKRIFVNLPSGLRN